MKGLNYIHSDTQKIIDKAKAGDNIVLVYSSWNYRELFLVVSACVEKNLIPTVIIHEKYIKFVSSRIEKIKFNCKIDIYTTTQLIDGDLKPMSQFDYIVGNPPYQYSKESGVNSQQKLYIHIIDKIFKFLKKGGQLNFVIPSAILINGQNNSFYSTLEKHSIKIVDYSVNKYFDIGQTVISLQIENTLKVNNIVSVKEDIVTEQTFPYIYPESKKEIFSIIWKLMYKYNNKSKLDMVQVQDSKIGNIDKKDFLKSGKIQVISHYAKQDPIYIDKWTNNDYRVIIPNTPPSMQLDNLYQFSQSPTTIGFLVSKNTINSVNAKSLLSYMKSKLIQFYTINYSKEYKPTQQLAGNFHLSQPLLDKIWTDDELYKEFNITDDEIKVIEDWYKEWKK